MLSGISIEQVGALHRRLGITNAGELSTALNDGSQRALAGLDPEFLAALRSALGTLRDATNRIPLGRAYALMETFTAGLREACREVEDIGPVGSLRRFEATVGDIELLAVAPDSRPVMNTFIHLPGVSRVLHRGPAKATVEAERLQVELRVVSPAVRGSALLHYTGSREHTGQLRRHAAARGLPSATLTAANPDEARRTEEEVYSALGLAFIPPELRQGTGEVEAAANGALPRLVDRSHIRGDLHMHTTWSDGRDSIEAMVLAARELGYEYVAITDHSPASAGARGLTAERLLRQIDEVDNVRKRIRGITVLQGLEVDILPDGTLDSPDWLLERLDIVLASLHDSAGQTDERLTERYLSAIQHPLANIITHPTNRLIGYRDGYALDFDLVFAAAVQTGTVLEIDGAPAHLDMDGALARRAVAAGVMVSIDSDCHRADWLDRQMRFGVATARRGWVEPAHVLNTRPLAEVRDLLAAKRQRLRA